LSEVACQTGHARRRLDAAHIDSAAPSDVVRIRNGCPDRQCWRRHRSDFTAIDPLGRTAWHPGTPLILPFRRTIAKHPRVSVRGFPFVSRCGRIDRDVARTIVAVGARAANAPT
jgi:hypothetical protein